MVSATQFTLELSGVEVGRKKLETKDEEITTTSVHEMVHCIRASKYPDCNVLMENIASEGLAYYAQAQAQQDMFDMPRSNTVLDDELDGEAVLDHLYCEPRRLESVSGSLYIDNQLKSEWLYNSASKEWFHWGQRLGIWCVKSWIEDIGYDFSELMDMPADEMLAV